MMDRLLERGLGSSFDMPSVYITGPTGIEATSSDRIIQQPVPHRLNEIILLIK